MNEIPTDGKGNVTIQGADFFKAVAARRQYTIFGDTSHKTVEIHEALAKEAHIKALAEGGIRHLFLEQKRHRQNEIDDFYKGKMSAEELYSEAGSFAYSGLIGEKGVRQGRALVAMIVHARKYGIQVHLSDPDSQVVLEDDRFLLRRDHPLYDSDPEAAENLIIQNSIENTDELLEFDRSLSPAMKKRMEELSQKISEATYEERYTMNQELASFIASKAGNEKAAVFYGAGHMDQPEDLDEYLGRENVTTVALLASTEQETSQISSLKTPRDLPDYAYFIDEDRATQKRTRCTKIGASLKDSGVQICEHTLDMGAYHPGSMKEEVQIKR